MDIVGTCIYCMEPILLDVPGGEWRAYQDGNETCPLNEKGHVGSSYDPVDSTEETEGN